MDDLAAALAHLAHLMRSHDGEEVVNVGCGTDITIRDLAELVGYENYIGVDPSQSDGTPRKLLEVSRPTALGSCPRVDLEGGIQGTYCWLRRSRQHCAVWRIEWRRSRCGWPRLGRRPVPPRGLDAAGGPARCGLLDDEPRLLVPIQDRRQLSGDDGRAVPI